MKYKHLIVTFLFLDALFSVSIPVCYAGFYMGMAGAVKDKVEKLDKKVEEAKNTVVIEGKKTISGESFELEPGMTVKFKEKFLYTGPGGPIYEGGEMELTNGAKLIAKGTWSEPIIFKNDGKITFTESSDGINSIIEYCRFEEIKITANTTITIQQSKFNKSDIRLYKNNETTIQYNDFYGEPTFSSSFVRAEEGEDNEPNPIIKYNNFENSYEAITVFSVPNSIDYNNITNIESYAIYYYKSSPSTYTVTNNYIADCNGETGVDTDGSQSKNVKYDSPRTSPVPDAGVGW